MLLCQHAYTNPPAAFDSDNGALFFPSHFLPAVLSDNKSYKHLINELAVQDMQSGPGGQKEMSRPFELCDEQCTECNN